MINNSFAGTGRALIDVLDSLDQDGGVRVIKRNMVRTVLCIEIEGVPLIVKKYHSSGLIEALKSFVLPSRASSEWNAMLRMREAGIPTARPVFFGEQRRAGFLKSSFFAATEIENVQKFGLYLARQRKRSDWIEKRRFELFEVLSRLTADLHKAGISHGDYHTGNILASVPDDRVPEIHLIDLHSVSFPKSLSRKTRLLNLARIAEVIIKAGKDRELNLFLGRYLQHLPELAPSLAALRQEVESITGKLLRRRAKSRTRRCLMRSSGFTPSVLNGFKLNHRRSYTKDVIMEALNAHDSVTSEDDPRLLHPFIKNKVTGVEVHDPNGLYKLCVKEYRRRTWAKRHIIPTSEAKRAWIAGRGLEVRRIETPDTVAWVRGRGREFLITRFTKGQRLHKYLESICSNLSPRKAARQQRVVATELAAFVKKIHDTGIRHRDLSEKNIIVEERNGRRVYLLIDCDTVTFKTRLGRKDRVRNLIQLGHMPDDINVLAKAYFIKQYLGKTHGHEWRSIMRKVNEGVLLRMKRKRARSKNEGLEDPHPIPSRLKGHW